MGFGEDGSGTAGSSSPTEVVKIQRPSTYWDLRMETGRAGLGCYRLRLMNVDYEL